MAFDDIIGKGFHGYLESEDPLELKQKQRHLFDDKSHQRHRKDKSETNIPRFFLNRWPFNRRKSDKRSEESEEKFLSTSEEISDGQELSSSVEDVPSPSTEEINMDSIDEEEEASVEEYSSTVSGDFESLDKSEVTLESSSPYEDSVSIDIPSDEEELPFIEVKKKTVKPYRKRGKGIWKLLTRLCPCLAILLFSKRTEYRGIKAMLGFPIGVLFGYALRKLVLDRLQLSPFASQTLGMVLVLSLGIGFAMSTQVRCICFLTIPALCGKSGRAYVSTFVITFVITGPISNILSNGRESMRVMTCIGSLNLNHTIQRYKLMFKPVKEIVWDFIGASDKIQQGTKGIEGAYKEIDKEVKDEEETKKEVSETEKLDKEVGHESRVGVIKKKFSGTKSIFGAKTESLYGMKSEFRCEGIFTKGVKNCYKVFGDAYDRCHYYLPIIGYLLCWPMKLTLICDIASSYMGRRTCDSNVAMSPGFGESMDTAEAVQREFNKELGVSVQYKITIPEETVDQITPQDISASVKHQFEKRKRALDFLLNVITRILALMFLQVFHVSRKYCNQYLRTIQFDNKYITSYFRHIDARRRKKGKKTLLPLKKGERLELLEPFKVRFSSEEKVAMVFNVIRIVGELMTVSILLAFDWIFYEFLMLLQRHAQVTYYQTGVHHVKMTVYGDGFVGNMVRSVLKGFDKKHTIDELTSTATCLPQPTKLDDMSVIILYSMFLVLIILMLIESYALRLRRVVCSFFYPKREKRRVLFLYNERLRKRLSYMQHMRNHVRKMAREQAVALDTGVFFSLRHLFPRWCGWLGQLGLGRRKCLVCEEVETKNTPFTICSQECPFAYCPECWSDVRGKCYVCLPDDGDDSPLSEDDSESDEEE
ncbi:hypothetical protein JTE90_004278 [Oedothorax gibbosus]|uniref:Dendritic cell-specific transmembrane protein-like domain-containing protein n=1 Tax=Oedothorax gibbosus TaxID=931172 RepID=A0AAV6VKK9_9ARAC|nr:hypothetical protein JTE90_004278 [Oedothorax gibbosus]